MGLLRSGAATATNGVGSTVNRHAATVPAPHHHRQHSVARTFRHIPVNIRHNPVTIKNVVGSAIRNMYDGRTQSHAHDTLHTAELDGDGGNMRSSVSIYKASSPTTMYYGNNVTSSQRYRTRARISRHSINNKSTSSNGYSSNNSNNSNNNNSKAHATVQQLSMVEREVQNENAVQERNEFFSENDMSSSSSSFASLPNIHRKSEEPIVSSDLDDATPGFDRVSEAIEEIKKGNFVVVLDDEDRENEGDLIIAANHVTPEKMAFMNKHTSGIICVSLKPERCKELDLPLMVPREQVKALLVLKYEYVLPLSETLRLHYFFGANISLCVCIHRRKSSIPFLTPHE